MRRDAARGLLGSEERGAAWIRDERERRKMTALKGREALTRSRMRVLELHKVFGEWPGCDGPSEPNPGSGDLVFG